MYIFQIKTIEIKNLYIFYHLKKIKIPILSLIFGLEILHEFFTSFIQDYLG